MTSQGARHGVTRLSPLEPCPYGEGLGVGSVSSYSVGGYVYGLLMIPSG